MVSSIANIMKIYKLKPKHHLTKFFGTLYVNQVHYVSVFIDTESRRVYTCDSLPHTSNYQTDIIILMRKWTAKSMSIGVYYIKNNETGLDLSFGSDIIAAGVQFIDKIEKKSRIMVELILCCFLAPYSLVHIPWPTFLGQPSLPLFK